MLKNRYSIIMWHVLSGDFDNSISKEECLANVIANTEAGSIVVFHDSIKAAPRMLYALEESLRYLIHEGFTFRSIS